MVGVEHWQGEGVKPEKPEQGALRYHGHVDEDVTIRPVEEARGLDLEEVRMVLDE